MTALEKLHQEAYDKGIDVVYYHIGEAVKAMYYSRGDIKGIALDRGAIGSAAEERVVLAEEMVHEERKLLYELGEDCNLPVRIAERDRMEYKARKETIKKLLPVWKIKDCISRHITELWEMAEYLEVSEDFLKKAIEYYISKGELIPYITD